MKNQFFLPFLAVGLFTGLLAVSGCKTSMNSVENAQKEGQRQMVSDSRVITDGSLDNSGTINVTGAANALHKVTATNTATGVINVLGGGTLTVDLVGTLANAGDINVTGTAEINDNDVTNTGTIDVLALGSLTFDNTTQVNNDDGAITVAGTGTLVINNASIDQDNNAGPANPGSLTIDDTGTANLQGTAAITDGSHAPLGVAENALPMRSTTFTHVVSCTDPWEPLEVVGMWPGSPKLPGRCSIEACCGSISFLRSAA